MWTFSVEPGTYAVTASASGYNSATKTCQVTTGHATDCSIELTKPSGGGGGGTSDYDQLQNRPQINNHIPNPATDAPHKFRL